MEGESLVTPIQGNFREITAKESPNFQISCPNWLLMGSEGARSTILPTRDDELLKSSVDRSFATFNSPCPQVAMQASVSKMSKRNADKLTPNLAPKSNVSTQEQSQALSQPGNETPRFFKAWELGDVAKSPSSQISRSWARSAQLLATSSIHLEPHLFR